jgi:FKBP-type peptidyl-prolyl cis-trans isomerase
VLKEEKGMALVKISDTVTVHYTVNLNDGMIFDTSADREPLEFLLGDGRIISGFDPWISFISDSGISMGTQPSSVGNDLNFQIQR